MDEVDVTTRREELMQRLRDEQREAERAQPRDTSDECLDCGDPIPEARQQATGGTTRCTDCQSFFDVRG